MTEAVPYRVHLTRIGLVKRLLRDPHRYTACSTEEYLKAFQSEKRFIQRATTMAWRSGQERHVRGPPFQRLLDRRAGPAGSHLTGVPGAEDRSSEGVTMLSNAVPKLTYYSRYILYRQVYEELMEETTAGNFKAPRTALCQLWKICFHLYYV